MHIINFDFSVANYFNSQIWQFEIFGICTFNYFSFKEQFLALKSRVVTTVNYFNMVRQRSIPLIDEWEENTETSHCHLYVFARLHEIFHWFSNFSHFLTLCEIRTLLYKIVETNKYRFFKKGYFLLLLGANKNKLSFQLNHIETSACLD